MIQRIRTSTTTANNLDKMQAKLKVSTKASLLRICISVSLNNPDSPLSILDGNDSKYGFDISLSTLFGEHEVLYKSMIRYHAKIKINESEFAQYVLAHIERGMIEVYGDFVMTNSLNDLISKLARG